MKQKTNYLLAGIVIAVLIGGIVIYLNRQNKASQPFTKQVTEQQPITSTPSSKKAVLKSLPIDSQNAEGAFMQNGKVFFGQGGNFAEMLTESSNTLSNGAIVKGNGEITESDGNNIILKEGQAYYFEK